MDWSEMGKAYDALSWLQDWHAAHRRAGQEAGRVRIKTLDNPGWWVRIDLAGTELASRPFTTIDNHKQPHLDWFFALVSHDVYDASSGPLGLGRCLEEFRLWAEQNGA